MAALWMHKSMDSLAVDHQSNSDSRAHSDIGKRILCSMSRNLKFSPSTRIHVCFYKNRERLRTLILKIKLNQNKKKTYFGVFLLRTAFLSFYNYLFTFGIVFESLLNILHHIKVFKKLFRGCSNRSKGRRTFIQV